MCDDVEWINGLSYPIVESYHPNRSGHASGYVPVTKPLFGVTAPAGAAAMLSASTIEQDARRFTAVDRKIRPKEFVAPDLTTARARAAAAAAGVDLSSRASIDRADRIWSERQAAEWAARN